MVCDIGSVSLISRDASLGVLGTDLIADSVVSRAGSGATRARVEPDGRGMVLAVSAVRAGAAVGAGPIGVARATGSTADGAPVGAGGLTDATLASESIGNFSWRGAEPHPVRRLTSRAIDAQVDANWILGWLQVNLSPSLPNMHSIHPINPLERLKAGIDSDNFSKKMHGKHAIAGLYRSST